MTLLTLLLLGLAFTFATATQPRTEFTRYRSWNSRTYPVWKAGDPRFRNCWSGGEVTFNLKSDGPTLTGARATFSINLNFPPNQTVLSDGQVVWAQNSTINGKLHQEGQAVYPNQDNERIGVFPDGTPFTKSKNKKTHYVFVWKTLGRYWQVADGPSSSLSIGTDNVPLGSYNMEVVIYHCRGKNKFIPLGYASTVFTITDQIPFRLSLAQVNDINQDDQNFIQNRAIAFTVNLHDPSQYLNNADISFSWDFGDNTGTLISRDLTVTHTYLAVGTFKPQVVLMASIPNGCGNPTAVVPIDASAAPAVVVIDSTPAAVPATPAVGADTITVDSPVSDTTLLTASVQPAEDGTDIDTEEVEVASVEPVIDAAAVPEEEDLANIATPAGEADAAAAEETDAAAAAVVVDTTEDTDAAAAVEVDTTEDTDAAAAVEVDTTEDTDAAAAVEVDTTEDTDAATAVEVDTTEDTDAATVVEVDTTEDTDAATAVEVDTTEDTDAAAAVEVDTTEDTDEAAAGEEDTAVVEETTDTEIAAADETAVVTDAAEEDIPVVDAADSVAPVTEEEEAAAEVVATATDVPLAESAVDEEANTVDTTVAAVAVDAAAVDTEVAQAVTEPPLDNVVVPAPTETFTADETVSADVTVDTEAEVQETQNEVAATAAPAEQPAGEDDTDTAEGEVQEEVEIDPAQVPVIVAKRQAPELTVDCMVYRYGSLATSVEVIQGIESVEIVQMSNVVSMETELDQNAVDVTITCQGSLPNEVCTIISDADCITPVETVCTAATPSPDCRLTFRQFFNDSGVFCINVSLTNDVSFSVTSAKVSVSFASGGSPTGTTAIVLGVMVLSCVICCIGLMYRRYKQYQPLTEDDDNGVRSAVTSVPLLLWNLLSRQSPGESRPLLQGRIV